MNRLYLLRHAENPANLTKEFSYENHNCSITEMKVESRGGRQSGRLIAWARCDHLHGAAAELVSGFMKHE